MRMDWLIPDLGPVSEPKSNKCPVCKGWGKVDGVGFLGLGSQVCPKCKGTGKKE